MELLHVLIPASASIAALVNPTNPVAETDTRNVEQAARSLGRQIHILHASSEREFDSVFATLAQLRVGALLIVSDNFFNSRSERLAALTMRHAVPAIYQYREFAAAGGLMSEILEAVRREFGIAHRVLDVLVAEPDKSPSTRPSRRGGKRPGRDRDGEVGADGREDCALVAWYRCIYAPSHRRGA